MPRQLLADSPWEGHVWVTKGANTMGMARQPKLSLLGAPKGEVRTQFAALCYRVRQGKIQVLVITSRRSKRWIMPKGWPMDGKTPAASALREAWEEAGVRGTAQETALGAYTYGKKTSDDAGIYCMVMLYPVKVKTLAKKFPEKGQRKRRWVSRKKAARLVNEPELGRLIMGFDPRHPQPDS